MLQPILINRVKIYVGSDYEFSALSPARTLRARNPRFLLVRGEPAAPEATCGQGLGHLLTKLESGYNAAYAPLY